MFVTYVLYSSTYDKIYIGYTSDLMDRFHSHNQFGAKGYTVKFRPWEVIHVESKADALLREKALLKNVLFTSELDIDVLVLTKHVNI